MALAKPNRSPSDSHADQLTGVDAPLPDAGRLQHRDTPDKSWPDSPHRAVESGLASQADTGWPSFSDRLASAGGSAVTPRQGQGEAFGRIPLAVVQSGAFAQLKPAAKAVLFVLYAHGRGSALKCWPSVTTIALEARLSDRSVQRALKELELIGLKIDVGGGRGRTNSYSLAGITPQRVTQLSRNPDTARTKPRQRRHPEQRRTERNRGRRRLRLGPWGLRRRRPQIPE